MKIEITFVAGGNPVVEVNEEYLDLNGGHLANLKKEMVRITKARSWFKDIKGVTAWGGEERRGCLAYEPYCGAKSGTGHFF